MGLFVSQSRTVVYGAKELKARAHAPIASQEAVELLETTRRLQLSQGGKRAVDEATCCSYIKHWRGAGAAVVNRASKATRDALLQAVLRTS